MRTYDHVIDRFGVRPLGEWKRSCLVVVYRRPDGSPDYRLGGIHPLRRITETEFERIDSGERYTRF